MAATAAPAGASVKITWKSTYYKKYLGIYQGGTKDGQHANIYAWENAAHQKWTAIDEGCDTSGYTEWAFVNQNSGECLEDHAYEKSGYADQWDCGSYGANTRWPDAYNPNLNEPPTDSYALINYGNSEPACPSTGDWVIWESGIFPSWCTWQ